MALVPDTPGISLKVSRLPEDANARKAFPSGEIYVAIEGAKEHKTYFALDLYQAIEMAKALMTKVEQQLNETVRPWDQDSFEVKRR